MPHGSLCSTSAPPLLYPSAQCINLAENTRVTPLCEKASPNWAQPLFIVFFAFLLLLLSYSFWALTRHCPWALCTMRSFIMVYCVSAACRSRNCLPARMPPTSLPPCLPASWQCALTLTSLHNQRQTPIAESQAKSTADNCNRIERKCGCCSWHSLHS